MLITRTEAATLECAKERLYWVDDDGPADLRNIYRGWCHDHDAPFIRISQISGEPNAWIEVDLTPARLTISERKFNRLAEVEDPISVDDGIPIPAPDICAARFEACVSAERAEQVAKRIISLWWSELAESDPGLLIELTAEKEYDVRADRIEQK